MRIARGPEPIGPFARVVPSPRPGGGVRWMTELSIAAEADYAAAVWRTAGVLEARLEGRVVANRVAGPGLALESWTRAHARWRAHMRAGLAHPQVRAVLKADVRDCYASVTPSVAGAQLRTLGASSERVRDVVGLLTRFGDEGVRGLPIGPDASAVLANLVLQAVDERLARADVRHLRWVDDVIVFARGRTGIAHAHDALERALGDLGLRLNDAKSAVILDRAEATARLGLGLHSDVPWAPSPSAGSCVR